jgi:hypothetical protein
MINILRTATAADIYTMKGTVIILLGMNALTYSCPSSLQASGNLSARKGLFAVWVRPLQCTGANHETPFPRQYGDCCCSYSFNLSPLDIRRASEALAIHQRCLLHTRRFVELVSRDAQCYIERINLVPHGHLWYTFFLITASFCPSLLELTSPPPCTPGYVSWVSSPAPSATYLSHATFEHTSHRLVVGLVSGDLIRFVLYELYRPFSTASAQLINFYSRIPSMPFTNRDIISFSFLFYF